MVANFKMLSEAGFVARFCWHTNFDAFSNHEFDSCLAGRADLLRAKKGDLVFVWFPSVAALLDMMLVRIFTQATAVYVFHEPFSSLRSYRESGFGLLKTAKVALVSLVSYGLVSFAHKVVLPSSAALAAYKARYNMAKQYAQFPLMFDDEAVAILPKENREYIAYIGTVAEDHAFDEFLKFAFWVLENGELQGYKILIATRSALAQETAAKLQPYVDAGMAVIQSGRPLSNEEINGFYSRSMVVWNAYRRSMQSGVLPKAYMFGTPVIITSVNRSEFFVDKVTGIEVSPDYDVNEILAAIGSIVSGFSEYSKACRAVFCEKFFYRSFAEPFVEFVTSETHGGIA
ncbi:MAG: hypothetical protein AB7F79_07150 [Steroidobacteraceae bacterium]